MTFDEWAQRHPHAAAELAAVFMPTASDDSAPLPRSEAEVQQRVRFDCAQRGWFAWRNNVGQLEDKRGVPVRFGLANDSAKLNRNVKSSDLILAIPTRITREHLGQTIARFGSVECKAPGWRYTGTPRERAQMAWLTLIRRIGGFAIFSTGELKL